jgi:hypothetical protein
MISRAWILIVFTILVIEAPLVGVSLSGRSAALFASFPPLTTPAAHQPFSWPVFMLYLVPAAGVSALIGAAACRNPVASETGQPGSTRNLPLWGWVALAVLVISWVFAWTRFAWFDSYQRHTFIPLWLSFIVFVNAVCVRQSGTCPMLHEPVFFAGLFPLSAAFWWFFEYLNQFVQNWYYTGVSYGTLTYSMHATISFATVLPAVYTTRRLISEMEWFRDRFSGLPRLNRPVPAFPTWSVLLISCAGLVGVGLWPEELFSLLWLAPLLILTALLHLAGQPTLLTGMADGDWRPAVSAAMAALACGFFWELWNFYSLARWVYSIPYVHRFQLFEMPMLGYLGYLPFGLLCIEITEFFKDQSNKRRNTMSETIIYGKQG